MMEEANVLLSPITSSNTNTTITSPHNVDIVSNNTSTITLTPGKLLNSSPYANPKLLNKPSGESDNISAMTSTTGNITSTNILQPNAVVSETHTQRTSISDSTTMTATDTATDTATATTSTGTSSSTTHTTPLTSPISHIKSKTTSETDDVLPPFSFSKRPVDCPKNRISSLSFTDSTFFPISTEPKEQITKKNFSPPPSLDMDYNNQIRFPRMSSTYYTKRNSLEFERPVSTYSPESNKESSREAIVDESKDTYKPAIFDLTKPLRRLSMPSKQEQPTGVVNPADDLLLEQYTTNNYIYERKMNQDRLRSIENDKVNIVVKQPRIRNQSSFPKLKECSSKSLHQVYELKKPLLTPAVLRPTYTNTESSENQLIVQQSQIEVAPHPIKTIYTINAPEFPIELDIEPIHSHWKSNNVTNNCMSCFKPFGSSLLSLIYDMANKRHHCRFCGFIYCTDCLVQDNEPNYNRSVTLLDSQAQFVIPILKNLDRIPSQAYKFFKVCKRCNLDYNVLVEDINRSLEGDEWKYLSNLTRDELKKYPFICVENPYVGNTSRFRANTENANMEEGFGRKISGIGDIPSDWTWSSF